MINTLDQQNKIYWQEYKPGTIPTTPLSPPKILLDNIHGPILDVGTGDGILAEELSLIDFDVYGIDIAKSIIENNQKKITRVNYSIQDITTRTNFPDNFFELVIFKFTLTNIHKEAWEPLGKEIFRILKPTGCVWIVEPLVSESYVQRYKLASNFVSDKNCVYVFNDKDLAATVNTRDDLQNAINNKLVSRIVKHYTIEELKSIFNKLTLTNHKIIPVTSPSGFVINTFEGIFKKS